MADVVVIGCGISGIATAWELARSGMSVVVVDRYGPAAMASGWTLAGVRQSGRDPAELPLAMAAIKIWENLDDILESPTGYTQEGNLRIGMSEADLPALREIVAAGQSRGLKIDFLPDSAAVRTVAPAIAPDIACATFCPTDGHADPDATMKAYVGAAKHLGVQMLFGETVVSIEATETGVTAVNTKSQRIPAACVVMATGVFGNELLAPYGVGLPLDVRFVTVVKTQPTIPLLKQVISVADVTNAEAACAGRQQLNGAFRFTSGIETWGGALREKGGRPYVSPPIRALAETISSFGAVVPAALDVEIDEFWCGLIDQTPDALPVLDKVAPIPGLFIARGFSGHGFCLGPVTGKIMAALVRNETPPLDISAFSLDRFTTVAPRSFNEVTLHG